MIELLFAATLAVTPAPGVYCRPFPIERIKPAENGGFLLRPSPETTYDWTEDEIRRSSVHVRDVYPSPDHQVWICQRAGEPVDKLFLPDKAA